MSRISRIAVVLLGIGVIVAVAVAAPSAKPAKPPRAREIVWADFKEGTAYAQKNNLPVMMHFTTSWCGWCKKLAKEVYTVPEVIQLSWNFVCIKVDGDKEKEVVQHYSIRGYPTILFANSKGEEVHRIGGFMPADGFAAQMRAALKKLGIEETTATDEKKK